MSTISKVVEKLRDPEYRKAFVSSQINIGIPFQIRAMLKNRPGWTQETLAERAQMLQPRISGLMTPGKTRPNIETLRRIAEAFDCGLVVRFAPFSELARWSEEFDPDSFAVPEFENDTGFVERKEPSLAAVSTTNADTLSMATVGTIGTSLEKAGKTPEVQSLLRYSSMGVTQVVPVQRMQGVAIPSGIFDSSLSRLSFLARANVVAIDHGDPRKGRKQTVPHRTPFGRRRTRVYA